MPALRLEKADEKTFCFRRTGRWPCVWLIFRDAALRTTWRVRVRRPSPPSLATGRFEIEVGEIISRVVVQGQQVQSGFFENNGPDIRLVPDVPTAGGHG
jgi:hypothetical protein